jgi:hypothetical protein
VPIALTAISIVAFVTMILESRRPTVMRYLPLIVVGAIFLTIIIPDFQESPRSADHPWVAELSLAEHNCRFESAQHTVLLLANPAQFSVKTTCGAILNR